MMNACEQLVFTKAKQQLECNHSLASIYIEDMYKIDNVHSEATVSCGQCSTTDTFPIGTDVYYGVQQAVLEL